MADDEGGAGIAPSTEPELCAECGKVLTAEDRVAAGDKVFCRSCHAMLRQQLELAVQGMSEDINYVNATVGALLGGTVGVLVWWGFTVATSWAIGIIAIGIGWAVGWGTVRFAGDKRSRNLQFLSAGVAVASWVVATYLVNMTFINRELAKQGEAGRVTFPPPSVDAIVAVLGAGFGIMDVVFLAIMVWEAWKFPRPIRLPPPPTG